MRYDDKWRRDLRGQYSDYITGNRSYNTDYAEDDTVKDSSSLIQTLLIAGGIAAFGYGLYKSGALKGVIKGAMEDLSDFNSIVPETFGALKTWTKSTDDAPINSIFRKNIFKSIESFKEFIKNKNVLKDTLTDVSNLRQLMRDRIDYVNKQAANIVSGVRIRNIDNNTQLHSELSGIETMLSHAMHDMSAQRGTIGNKALQLLLESRSVAATSAQAKRGLYRDGFRPLNLEDVLRLDTSTGAPEFLSTRPDFTLSKDTTDLMKKLFGEFSIDDTGGSRLAINAWDKMKNITIDSSLKIDEAGKIYDHRNLVDYLNGIAKSAALDFHIPIVGLRPLEMIGVHKSFNRFSTDFAYMNKKIFNPGITNMPGRVSIGEVNQNRSVLFMKGNVYDFTPDGDIVTIARNGKLASIKDEFNVGYGIPSEADRYRKLAGLHTKEYNKFERSDGMFRYTYSNIADKLSLGKYERSDSFVEGDFSIFNPTTYLGFMNKLFGNKFSPFKSTASIPLSHSYGIPEVGDVYAFIPKSKTIGDIFHGRISVGDLFKQFTAGRNNMKDVTGATGMAFHMLDRLSSSLGTVNIGGINLGLGIEDMSSIGGIFKALMLKRILPVYLGIQAYEYLNMESEKFGGTQIEDNLARIAANTDLVWHGLKDNTGLTSLGKWAEPLMPGGEQISDIPGLGFLNLSDTQEERLKWYEEGMTPVRKGRYWPLGNTPFTGGKVEYFQPNWYRRTLSDYQFTDVQYGSREEYFENAPFPTPRYPLAPLNHFVFDRYHYEKKHYEDRPYMLTSPLGENLPIIGPLFGNTVGQLLKPQQKMHMEYWAQPTDGYSTIDPNANQDNVGVVIPDALVGSNKIAGGGVVVPTDSGGQLPGASLFNYKLSTPKQDLNEIVYVTASGQSKVVGVPKWLNIGDLNQQLRSQSIKKVQGSNDRMYLNNNSAQAASQIISGIESTLNEQYNTWSEVAGIYGFGINTLLGTGTDTGDMAIEESGYMNSINRSFWESDLGGMGGELSEIYRRFIPKRSKDIDYYNPIRNQMSTWLPGTDYFSDFQHGDPYMKVKKGEARLPGEGYESIYGMKDPLDMPMRASSVGKGVEGIIRYLLHKDDVMSEEEQDILGEGTKIHKHLQSMLNQKGLLLDKEVEINDRRNNITGHYDARVFDKTSPTGDAILEFKTTSAKRMAALTQPREEHLKQLNFYLHYTKRPKGYIIYADRDNPDESQKVFPVAYDDELYRQTMYDLNKARQIIKDGIKLGTIQRGDLYDYFTRFKILADVAPYSKEFREYKAMMSQVTLTKEQEAEAKEIRKRVIEQNKPLRIYPYKFTTANLKDMTVTVTRKIDNEMFMTEEFPDNPIKLAGLSLPNSPNTEEGRLATKEIDKYIWTGSKVKIGIDADELQVVQDNTYKTIKAVVYAGTGPNLNKRLIEQGIGKENEKDFSPAGVHARFTAGQRMFGSIWERFAHMDTMFHTKLLQVRSALESYKRRDLYGKDFQRWEHPLRDFLKPTIDEYTNNTGGVIIGAVVGSLFGRTTYGRIIGAVAGAATVGIGKVYKNAYEIAKGERWIPERRVKERDINEYVDILKFLKYKRLYEEYAERSKNTEGFDVKQFMDRQIAEGDQRKSRAKQLEEYKRMIKSKGNVAVSRNYSTYKPKYGRGNMTVDEMVTAVNKELTELASVRKAYNVPKLAQKAIGYYNMSERTMYGYDPGEPIENILSAIPKKERQYLAYFMKAPEEERMEILELAPRYIRRVLEQTWGLPMEDKPNLASYFQTHQLPGPEWKGWDENIDMDLVKVKMVQKEGLDISDFNLWADDVKSANNAGPIPIPRFNAGESAERIKSKLEDILHGIGMTDLSVNYTLTNSDIDVDLNLKYDKKRQIEEYINQRGDKLFR